MLPLLRVTLLGCVLIATLGLAAGFNFSPNPQLKLGRVEPLARGALMAQEQHPEWKQFLVLAAVRRAEELERLRDLHDRPVELPAQPEAKQPEATRSVGLPAANMNEAADDPDVTGTVTGRTLGDGPAVEIGEASSTELPVGPPQTVAPPPQPPRIELPDQNSNTVDETQSVAAKPGAAEPIEAKRDPASLTTKAVETKPATAKPAAAKSRRAKPRAKQPAAAQNESAANPLAALFSIFEQTGNDARQ